MAGPVFTNNATGALAAAYSATATALTLVAGQGTTFPAPGAGEWFAMTIVDASNNIEIVHCTARTADTCTVLRGQEGTPARALGSGEKVEHRLTAGALAAIRDRPIDPSQIGAGTITGPMIAAGAITTGKIADGAVDTNKIFNGTVSAADLGTGAALANLGYTPVHQGGGVGQSTDDVFLGWSVNRLRATVGVTDLGYLLTDFDDGDPARAGYRGAPPNNQNTDYTIGLHDVGRAVRHSSGVSNVYYIAAFASVPILPGCKVEVMNISGGLIVAPAAGVTLTWLPSGGTGNRNLAAPGRAILECVANDQWWIYGEGIS